MSSATARDINSMSTCAACGKGGDHLKACTACHLVKYCNRDCQIAHRPKHKKECRKRAAELERATGDDNTSNSDVNKISEGISNVGLSSSVSALGKKTSTSCVQNQKQTLRSSGAINGNSISMKSCFETLQKKKNVKYVTCRCHFLMMCVELKEYT